MFRRAIYLKPSVEASATETMERGVDYLDAATAFLTHLSDVDGARFDDALERAYANERHVLSHEDAALVVAILRAIPGKLVAARLVDVDYLLDDASVARLRDQPIGEVLALSPSRGSDVRYAVVEQLGNLIGGVAQLLERAIAENLVIVLG